MRFIKPKTNSARFKSGYSKVEHNIVNATKCINSQRRHGVLG